MRSIEGTWKFVILASVLSIELYFTGRKSVVDKPKYEVFDILREIV